MPPPSQANVALVAAAPLERADGGAGRRTGEASDRRKRDHTGRRAGGTPCREPLEGIDPGEVDLAHVDVKRADELRSVLVGEIR